MIQIKITILAIAAVLEFFCGGLTVWLAMRDELSRMELRTRCADAQYEAFRRMVIASSAWSAQLECELDALQEKLKHPFTSSPPPDDRYMVALVYYNGTPMIAEWLGEYWASEWNPFMKSVDCWMEIPPSEVHSRPSARKPEPHEGPA